MCDFGWLLIASVRRLPFRQSDPRPSLSSTFPSRFGIRVLPTHFCITSGRSSPPSPSTTASMPILNRSYASQLQLWRSDSQRGKRLSRPTLPELLERGCKCLLLGVKCAPLPLALDLEEGMPVRFEVSRTWMVSAIVDGRSDGVKFSSMGNHHLPSHPSAPIAHQRSRHKLKELPREIALLYNLGA